MFSGAFPPPDSVSPRLIKESCRGANSPSGANKSSSADILSSGAGYEMVSDDAHKFTIVNEKAGVKTGDSNNILIPLAVMLSAMLALLIIAERRRRNA